MHHHAKLVDGREVTADLCDTMIDEELEKAKATVDGERYKAYVGAAEMMRQLIRGDKFIDFLTVPAYQRVLAEEHAAA